MPQNKTRSSVSDAVVVDAVSMLIKELDRRLKEKGRGTFSSSHEILGIVTEEYWELVDAVKRHGDDKAGRIKQELMDIAVACVFGCACIDTGDMDWL